MNTQAGHSMMMFDSSNNKDLLALQKSGEIITTIDIFEECLEELCEIEHPTLKPEHPNFPAAREAFFKKWKAKGNFADQGKWAYYPWLRTLVHVPDEAEYIRLRTSRNRNLVSEKEQAILNTKRIGIAGMSVGSNILNTLVLTGVGRDFRVADMDTISLPNLNRITAPVWAVGLNKAEFFTRRALEVDPHLRVEAFTNGLGEKNFDKFFSNPPLDIFVEEMDNPGLKIESRKRARELGIPVVMAADNGDGVLIDVERYDLEPNAELFNGRLKNIDLNTVSPDMPFVQKLALIAQMAGLSEATERMQDSIQDVGRTLNTWPQLGTAAVLAGVSLTFIVRRILLGEPMPSGRYKFNPETAFVPDYSSRDSYLARRRHTADTMKKFKEMQKRFSGK